MTATSARGEIDRIAERYREGRLRSDPRNLVEVLSDRELILERVAELSHDDDLVVIHPSGMLDALTELYEAYWARAEPITGTVPAEDDTFGADDVALLGMLKAGLKDQAIARQLGCSTRTATRRVAAVLTKLGADTRFQAGIKAAARGLI
ncbi:LuxR C-terminal-related transcriptional regulator [Streptomyces sp. NPDC051913]|uniref:helix-turn-helix transcriptional regulator n=1 Tax=Streptomyces sp. NPDC051913 TaxID=3365676 RepID=UPI0037D0B7F4